MQRILRNLDYKCYCADETVQNIYSRKQVISEMSKLFPEYVSDNMVNIEIIREYIFKDEQKRIALEKYVHPKVFEEFKKIINNGDSQMIFFIFPLIQNNIFENKYKTIYIDADEDIRLKRISKRKNYNGKISREIVKLQNSFEKKMKKNSNYYIKNNDSILQLEVSVQELIKRL